MNRSVLLPVPEESEFDIGAGALGTRAVKQGFKGSESTVRR
jgi:hypothetical protein